jgi:hypothetical protein
VPSSTSCESSTRTCAPTTTAGHVSEEEWQQRVLDDGSRHSVFKRFLTGERLREELGDGDVLHEGAWFVVYRSTTG